MKKVIIISAICVFVGGLLGIYLASPQDKLGVGVTTTAASITKPTVRSFLTHKVATTTILVAGQRTRVDIVWPDDGNIYWVNPGTTLHVQTGYRVATETPILTLNPDPMYQGAFTAYCETSTGSLVVVEYK